MGDLSLQLASRDPVEGSTGTMAAKLGLTAGARVFRHHGQRWDLASARTDDSELWAPCSIDEREHRVTVALAGRVALEPLQWQLADRAPGSGGLVCRVIADIYLRNGIGGLRDLSGNFAVVVIDETEEVCHLITDQAGCVICYAAGHTDDGVTICTHPDVLAATLGGEDDFDLASLAEFLETGRVTFPHSYYRNIKGLAPGSIFSFDRTEAGWVARRPDHYFRLEPDFDPGRSADDLADELAAAFQRAVHLRSQPRLGRTALAMSGGMDSRAILSCIEDPQRIENFVLVDNDNPESAAAAAVAEACGAGLHRIRRDFDHYGKAAEAGARIGGGMGGLASNHFLGVGDWFRERGIGNLLTGCYCDYLFKALALNTVESRWLRRERLTGVDREFYRPHYPATTRCHAEVEQRLGEWLPRELCGIPGEEVSFEVECRRSFPFAHEGDSAQRVIAQRVLPWFVPMADCGVLKVYRRIPPSMKLNDALFKMVLTRLCSDRVLQIPSSNTGAPILAGSWTRICHRYRSALLNRFNGYFGKGIGTRGSWPNWQHYVHHSELVREQWERREESSRGILSELVSSRELDRPVTDFRGVQVEWFQRLWTLKLWLECRVGEPEFPPPAASPSVRAC